jgi:short-subunit dehydrogenase
VKPNKLQPYYKDQTIWVIGASEGIGKRLCQDLHRLGAALILSARSTEKLKSLSNELRGCAYHSLDVSNYDAFNETCHSVFSTQKIDRIIYLPAYYEPMNLDQLDVQKVRATIDINLTAVFYLVEFIIPHLKKNPKTQLSVCGSVAGYFGLPYAQPYAATKAGVISIMQSLKSEHPGLDVKLINPGFVKTKLTEKNQFKMPGIITTEAASLHILNGLTKKSFEVHFPKGFTRVLKFINLLPYKFFFKVMQKVER